jgi:hypothetical protein
MYWYLRMSKNNRRKNYLIRSFIIRRPSQVLFIMSNQRFRQAIRHGWRGKLQELVLKPKDETAFGRTRCRCDNNIKTDPKVKVQENVDWVGVAGDREKWRSLVERVLQYLLL